MNAAMPHFLLFCQTNCNRTSGGGQWRFVLESLDGPERLEASGTEPDQTASRLDLLALVRGLEALNQPSRVTLVTGSRYVSHGLYCGLSEWRRNQWRWERYGKMTSIRNRDLWVRIDQALRFHRIHCRTWPVSQPAKRGTALRRFDAAHCPTPPRRCTPAKRWTAQLTGLVRQIVGQHDGYPCPAVHLAPAK
jgi:ribonuclease HI